MLPLSTLLWLTLPPLAMLIVTVVYALRNWNRGES